MKTNALLAFFFFLVALFASTRAEFVLDSEGQLVLSGGIYHLVQPILPPAGVGGAIIPHPNGSCSLAVVELFNNSGYPTIIESQNDEKVYITTDTPLRISFDPLPSNPCTQDPEWLVARDEDFGQNAVMVGNASEFCYPVSGCLYFKTSDSTRHHYNLVFFFDQNNSEPVAVKTDGYENRRLIVKAEEEPLEPLVLMLVKNHVPSHISMVV